MPNKDTYIQTAVYSAGGSYLTPVGFSPRRAFPHLFISVYPYYSHALMRPFHKQEV